MGVSGNAQFQLANSFIRHSDGLFVKKSDTSVHTGVKRGIILSAWTCKIVKIKMSKTKKKNMIIFTLQQLCKCLCQLRAGAPFGSSRSGCILTAIRNSQQVQISAGTQSFMIMENVLALMSTFEGYFSGGVTVTWNIKGQRSVHWIITPET